MKNQKLSLLRLQKQQKQLEEDPIPNVLVARKGLLHFHFCIYGLDSPYKGGYYHGVLQLHEDYPFAPPRLLFYTPSGRFQTNKPICTTFTNFHKQSWTSAWNVRTMITATVSFMTSNQGGLGSLNDNMLMKLKYASQSLSFNLKNQEFRSLFKQKLLKQNITVNIPSKNENESNQSSQIANKTNSNKLYILYLLLIIVLILYAIVRNNNGQN